MNAYELADDVIHMLESWSKAYPTDIFPEITKENIEYINAVNPNLSSRFFAHVGRHFIKKGFTPAINMLRQQENRIAELEDACIAMVEDGWLYCGAEGLNEAQQKLHKAIEAKVRGEK